MVNFSGCLMDAPSSWPPFTIAVVARCDICWHSRVVIARRFFERHGGQFSIELPLYIYVLSLVCLGFGVPVTDRGRGCV